MARLIKAAPHSWTMPVLVATLGYYVAASFATLTNVRTSLWVMGAVYLTPLLLLAGLALWLGARQLALRLHSAAAHPL